MNDGFKLSGGAKGVGPERACVRAKDLVAHLYGEATPAESRSFGEHLETCAVCRDELAAFGGVRGEISAWREEVLSAAPSIDFAPPAMPSMAVAAVEHTARKRSALAALREFFALSPVWLRAGSVAATLAVCALAGLAFARTEVRWDDRGIAFQMGVPTQTVEKRVEVSAAGTFTEQQVEEIAERRARQAVEKYQAQLADEQEKQVTGGAPVTTPERTVPIKVRDERQPRRAQFATRSKRNQRRGLEFESNDDELPRLYDLLREAN